MESVTQATLNCKRQACEWAKFQEMLSSLPMPIFLYFCFYTDFPPVRHEHIVLLWLNIHRSPYTLTQHSSCSISHVVLLLSTRSSISSKYAVISVLMNDAFFCCFVLITNFANIFEKFLHTAEECAYVCCIHLLVNQLFNGTTLWLLHTTKCKRDSDAEIHFDRKKGWPLLYEICLLFSGLFLLLFLQIKTFATNAVRMCTECCLCNQWGCGKFWRLLRGLNFHLELLNSHLQPKNFLSTLITLLTKQQSFRAFFLFLSISVHKTSCKTGKTKTSGKKT